MDGYQKLGKPPIVRPAALVGGLLYRRLSSAVVRVSISVR